MVYFNIKYGIIIDVIDKEDGIVVVVIFFKVYFEYCVGYIKDISIVCR